ncbi:MAG: hypothetical protein EAZ07_02640 [Cytophagales bacterium]|nr:MAG: hypothetical protein EAZ07_02640 [Cytophagales bacterium]
MKKFLLVFSFLLCLNVLQAKVITVNNASNNAQFSSLQAAFDQAGVDDTVYVHGSPTSYGNATIRKRIVLIGAGYEPSETQFQFSTVIGNLDLDSTASGGLGGVGEPINGTKIYAVLISTLSSNNTAAFPKRNITVERCRINNQLVVTGSNWTIVNCLINILNISNWNNIVVSNNFIYYLGPSNQPSVIFSNNIFLPNNGNVVWSGTVSYAIFSFNIFLNNSPINTNLNYCTFNSNIIGNVNSLVLVTTLNNNTGADNFNNTNPLFTKMPTPPPISLTNIFDPAYDFRLSANSVGKGKGPSGTDIGIYGGNFPMQGLGGASTLPQITRMDISNSVLPKTDKLKVSFKARKVN